MTRRSLLCSALALAACGSRRVRSPDAVPEGPVTLGWRFVPGAELTYRSVVRRVVARRKVARVEEWTYLVRDLDLDGVATLEGRLTGFGAGVEVDDTAVDDALIAEARAEERDAIAAPVTLRLGMDGRLVSCSARAFDRGLPHRALALRVPTQPVLPHGEWPDPGLARPFADLLPLGLDVRADGAGRLIELHHDGATTLAVIASEGRLRALDGPSILLEGTATWDAEQGRLERRTLTARLAPAPRDAGTDPGRLEIELFRA